MRLDRQSDMERHDGGYYVIDPHGAEEGPICPECYIGKGLVYLLESTGRGPRCSVCGKVYAGASPSVEGRRQRIL